ncbi:outer membrane protein assembly factor BamE [Pedomonas mirosovicensis]|uniref:outer membrane protein assembly factor BamE n=1 Tax=Pedomonas mirosovicensis TaxID=2908641 RepID=UPI00216AAF32|nr:outer membrane protein assembly factor BamE [Pedomonas mirosovicensis]MCH8685001.1 outer membrane protein assembly factor BamE [Pedomonas mirosovicensis]
MLHGLAKTLLIAAIAASTVSCTRIKDTKGYLADPQLVAAIQPGIDNKESVSHTLGRPSLQSEFDPNTWYYVSRQTEQLAFLNPKPVKHEVLVINFNDKGVVSKVEKLGMDQIVHVDPSNDKTPTRGRDISVWDQLFGNIGRFSPASGTPQQ